MRVQSIEAKRGTVSPSILFNHFFSVLQDSEYAAFHCGCITALSSVAVVHSGVGRLAILFLFYGCFTILFYSFYTQIGLTEAVPPLVAISLLSLLWNPIWVRIFAYDGISDFVTLAIPIVMFLTVTSIQSGKWGLIMLIITSLFASFPFLASFGFVPLSLAQMASIVLSTLLFLSPSIPVWVLPFFLLTSSIPSPLLLITHTLSLLLLLQTLHTPPSLLLLLFLSVLTPSSSFASVFAISLLPSLTLHCIHIIFTRSSSQLKPIVLLLLLSFLFLLFCLLRVGSAEALVSFLPSGSLHDRILEMNDLQELAAFFASNSSASVCSMGSLRKQYPGFDVMWDEEESVYYALEGVMCDWVLIAPVHDGFSLNGKCDSRSFSFLCGLLRAAVGREDAAVHFVKVYETTNHLYHLFRFTRYCCLFDSS